VTPMDLVQHAENRREEQGAVAPHHPCKIHVPGPAARARSATELPPQYYAAARSGHHSSPRRHASWPSSSSSWPPAAPLAHCSYSTACAPAIAVTAVQLPAFAAANGTVAFTFQQRPPCSNSRWTGGLRWTSCWLLLHPRRGRTDGDEDGDMEYGVSNRRRQGYNGQFK